MNDNYENEPLFFQKIRIMERRRSEISRLSYLTSILGLGVILGLNACKKDDPEPPVKLSFSSASQSVLEGGTVNVTILFDRNTSQQATLTVQLSGSAVYTEDYNTDPSGISGTMQVTIPAGVSSHIITVATVNNEIYVGEKNIQFTLSEVSAGFIIGSEKIFELTINEDEGPALVGFENSVASVQENSTTGVVINIPFSEPAKGPGQVSITWAANGAAYGTNFTTIPAAVNNTITYNVLDGAGELSLTLIPQDDSFFHEDFVIVFEITATTGSVKPGSVNRLAVTITEDESPSFASFSITDSVIPETQSEGIVVPISLSIPASEVGSMTISFTSSTAVYGTHFTTIPAASGSNVVLNVAKNDVASQLTIIPIDNNVDNNNRLIQFVISYGTGVVRPGGTINHIITLTDNEPTLRSVFLSFGRASAPLVTGPNAWNHIYSDNPIAGTTWSNLIRSDGAETTFDLVVDTYLTPQPHGQVTGINSGVFPDNAMKEYWYVPGPDQGITRGFRIVQLDNDVSYTIKIHGGTNQVSTDGKNTMTISVNGTQKILDNVTNNVTQILSWESINPLVSIFTINLTDSPVGGICPINAMEISWYED